MPNDPADRLIRAHHQRARIAACPEDGPADAAAAYAVQAQVWRALFGTARPTAWKAAASREGPTLVAPVWPTGLCQGGGSLPRAGFVGVGVEAEIAVEFGRDLPAGADRQAIVAALEHLHVAMELVATRLADPPAAGPHWRLADSLLNGGLVVGDAIADWRDRDWGVHPVILRADGQVVHQGLGRPPLDDLFQCLSGWLDLVGGARAGDIVTTGAWTGMHPLEEATCIEVEFPGLGRAAVRLDAG